MNEKITLDMLTTDSVSFKKQLFTIVDSKEYLIGEPWRKAYINSDIGRLEVENEVPEPYKSVIFVVWGSAPTVSN